MKTFFSQRLPLVTLSCLLLLTAGAAEAVTTRVSVSSAGKQQANNSIYAPTLSANGRFAAFESYASNLVTAEAVANPATLAELLL